MADKVNPLTAYNASLTPEQRREAASRAGKASAEARRKYRTQQDILRQILTLDVDDPQVSAAMTALGLDPTFGTSIALAMSRKGSAGDVDAARYVRDTVGERPTDQHQIALAGATAADMRALSTAELESMVADEVAGSDS